MRCPNAWRLAGSSAAELPLRGLQCTHVRIRWHPTNGLEQELRLTHLWHGVCATTSAFPCPHTVIKHAFGRHKSPAWRFRSGSRLGRRTPRSGSLPVHDLHRMGREACCRNDIAYPVSWRRVTHLQQSLRWGMHLGQNHSGPKFINCDPPKSCLRPIQTPISLLPSNLRPVL